MAEHGIDLEQRAHLLQHRLLLGDHFVDQRRFGRQGDLRMHLARAVEEIHRVVQHLQAVHGFAQVAQALQFLDQLPLAGQEFVHRRIEQADSHRARRHGAEDAGEILALDRQQLVEGALAVGRCFGDDHLDDDGQALDGVEHALGAAQADAHCTETHGALGIGRRVGIGQHIQAGRLVGPAEQGRQLVGKRRLDHRHGADENIA